MRPTIRCVFVLPFFLLACATQSGISNHDVAPVDSSAAITAFKRFKALEGTWAGKSTKGWAESITYQTIAGGSCVQESSFDAHPNEKMLTLIHMDGPRLMLTHYCVAKNQPRLVATSIDDRGARITFTFLDGTNLPTRDKGHMDKVVFHFVDADHFTSQWTWYQDGKESWMEEIVHTRTQPQPVAAGRT